MQSRPPTEEQEEVPMFLLLLQQEQDPQRPPPQLGLLRGHLPMEFKLQFQLLQPYQQNRLRLAVRLRPCLRTRSSPHGLDRSSFRPQSIILTKVTSASLKRKTDNRQSPNETKKQRGEILEKQNSRSLSQQGKEKRLRDSIPQDLYHPKLSFHGRPVLSVLSILRLEKVFPSEPTTPPRRPQAHYERHRSRTTKTMTASRRWET
mmetsp:Transcript_10818/g.20943  ORF Transcript_10818/g.20943 Transcript_10818/m.20943 type:complete len:204 (-) Transcript_10818:393-1004(-)